MQNKNYGVESVRDLNSSNIWGLDAMELAELWSNVKKEKDEDLPMSEDKVLNVLRLAFEVVQFDTENEREAAKYKTGSYVVLSHLDDKKKGGIAIRKKEIKRITDLSYENVKYISAATLLELIDRNFGGGWDSISLAIKDIIESVFDISTTTLPASRIHAKGGTLERKVADGYEVLEVAKGTWVEAIFAKKKELHEKLRFVAESSSMSDDENGDNMDDDDTESNDEDFYESYTPEADVKDDDDLAGEL